jgi:hypothetical protein
MMSIGGFSATTTKKNKKGKKIKKLFFEQTLLFRVIFAFVDSQLALGFDAASFACVLAS